MFGNSKSRPRSSGIVTGLSGNERFCLAAQGFRPVGVAVGNSVQSMGFLGGIGSAFSGIVGGEVSQVTQVIEDGRRLAFSRMVAEARSEGGNGLVGVTSELRDLAGNTEFLFLGSSVKREGGTGQPSMFSSAGDGQELYCHMDAGYEPLGHAFGNVAYSVGAAGGITGALRTLARGEVREYSDVFNLTRHAALDRLTTDARAYGANAVVGIRANVSRFKGVHEMLLTGTAVRHALLEAPNAGPVATSDLTGEEAWSMASLHYMPIKMLISTSVYSLGLVGGIKAMFKGLIRGEIPELTTMIYDAREQVFGRIHDEAAACGADEVVGVKSYVTELGSGLVEFMAVGTAVKYVEAATTLTPSLPPQAIIRDRDTWISGEAGMDLEASRGGG